MTDSEIMDNLKLIAIIQPNGNATIEEFDAEYWEEMPSYIDAEHLDAFRTQKLNLMSVKYGFGTDHITAWVDSDGYAKALENNIIGEHIYGNAGILGDLILTLEDAQFTPKSFESLETLEKIIADLGATVTLIDLDEPEDDDGRWDAWS